MPPGAMVSEVASEIDSEIASEIPGAGAAATAGAAGRGASLSAMYLEHFGLRELPFNLTPDTGFFFAYGHYADALNTLLVALRIGEGFIKVTGEVGTGKTLLCRKLLNSLGDDTVTAYLPNPLLTPSALGQALAEELGLSLARNLGQHHVLKQVSQHLIAISQSGRRVVLCLDEAQAMPLETLEALRLLTNLETEKRKLLQVVMFGQPELEERLNRNSTRQLRQRITFAYTLRPIDRTGLRAYLNHRLHTAGYRGPELFDAGAQRLLHRASRGIPRLINILAHKAMMAAYGQGATRIGRAHVRLAVRDTRDAQQAPRPRLRYWTLGSAMVLLASLLALYALRY